MSAEAGHHGAIMLQAFVVTLREGLEAFLIVAISLAYLRKTGRRSLIPAVHWGIVTSIAVSIGAGVLLARAANQALWEGILALVAAVLVASLIVHMISVAAIRMQQFGVQFYQASLTASDIDKLVHTDRGNVDHARVFGWAKVKRRPS